MKHTHTPKPCKTADDLIAALKLTNNGYLFAPSASEYTTAKKHPELFTVSPGGVVAKK